MKNERLLNYNMPLSVERHYRRVNPQLFVTGDAKQDFGHTLHGINLR